MRLIVKARRMPIGTISHGRKKIAEGKWVPVKRGGKRGQGVVTKRERDKKVIPKAQAKAKPKVADSWNALAKRGIVSKEVADNLAKAGERQKWGKRFDTKLMKAVSGLPSEIQGWINKPGSTFRVVYRKNLDDVPDFLKAQYERAVAVTVNGMRIEFIKGKPIDGETLRHELVHLAWGDLSRNREAVDALHKDVIADGEKVINYAMSSKFAGKRADLPFEESRVWADAKYIRSRLRGFKKTQKEEGEGSLIRHLTAAVELALMLPGGERNIFGAVYNRKPPKTEADFVKLSKLEQYDSLAYYSALADRLGVRLPAEYAIEEGLAYRAGQDEKFARKTFKSLGMLNKAKRMPIGTISRGRKKVAEGKWVDIKKERTQPVKGVDVKGISDGVKKAIVENPERVKHGHTAKNAFWILENGEVTPFKDKDIMTRKNAISVHSHSPENWKERPGSFQSFSGGDLVGLQHMLKYGYGNTVAVIVAEGKMDVFKGSDKLRQKSKKYLEFERELTPKVMDEIQKKYKMKTKDREINIYRMVLREMARETGSTYLEKIDWKSGKALGKSKTWSGYKLQGRTKFQGLPISIENERGTMRRGEDADGHEWATFMHIPYGYIRLTEGTDGDHVDCYVGTSWDSEAVFVVHQNDPTTGNYDEDKVMLGFRNAREAKKAYIRQYDRPGFFGSMDEYNMIEFKELLDKREGMKLKKALRTPGGIQEGTLIKSNIGSNSGKWYTVVEGHWTEFYVYSSGLDILEKAVKIKSHYSSEEVKARGMRWVTIRGARVLLQGTSGGGWVVVGGAGGKLNHMRVDKILGKEEYALKREEQKKIVKERKKELRPLTAEEMKQQRAKRKVEVETKRGLRATYEARVKEIMGAPKEDFKSKVTGKMMDEITDQARTIVETRKRKILDVGDERDIEKEKEKIVQQEVNKEIKNVERRALDALMSDYADEGDPNSKRELKKLVDKQKAMEILRARKEFRQAIKAVGTTMQDPKKPRLKMGDVFAATSKSTDAEIMEEVKQKLETARNIALYDRMNAQSRAINKYVSQGSASAINGILGDVFKTGAPFSPVMFDELGVDAVARITAMYIREGGQTRAVKDALEKFSAAKREKTVIEALNNADERLGTADELRNMAKGLGDDAEGLMSMAQANGYALKEMIAAQQELGTAVGSLQGMAHLINALEEPSADAVIVDMGTNLSRARDRAKKAGLQKGTYNIRKKRTGGKRLMMEVPRESIARLISDIQESKKSESKVERIKMHKENTGYTPPGMNKDATHPITKKRGPIKLDAAQEAGLHFFKEQGKVLLDFEAGLGKTAVAYAAAMEAIHNKGAKKVLVVTPAKLRDQFAEESSVFLDEENRKLVKSTGSMGPKKRREVYGDEKGIHVVGHDTLSSDWQAIKDAKYDMIVIDEMHELTPQGKGKGSQRFRGMMQLTDIPLKIGMSGTNIKNSKTELHRKVAFIDPDHTLGSISAFEKRYKGLNQGTSAFHESANDAFRKEISPWMYTQRNHLAVEHTAHKERVALTPLQRGNVRDIMKTYMKEKEAMVIGAAARRDANLYRVVHDDAFAHNSKAGRIVDIMNKDHPGEKALIHVTGIESLKSTKERIESEFGAGTVAVIMGEGPESAVTAIRKAKKDFNNPDSPVKFIIGTKSMEAGHNLQGGSVVFHLDQADTYASMDQRVKRSYRRGQDRDVTSYTLSGMNPLDLRKEDLIKRKKRETGILGNPQEIEGMDGSGFLSYLNMAEKEAGYGKQTATA